MDNKKILEDAREKIRNGNISEADKSLLGDILSAVAGMATANSSGRPDNSNIFSQIQTIANLVGGSSGGKPDNIISQIQSLANLVGMTGATSSGKPDVGNIIQNIAGAVTSESNSSAYGEESVGNRDVEESARGEERVGKTSGRKPQGLRRNEGRVSSVARNVADQLRKRNNWD